MPPPSTDQKPTTAWRLLPVTSQVVKKGISALPCGVDKYNSYRKYGETSVLTQTSHLGVFRAGLWYEWARTDRHQYPSDPLSNWADQALPNFAEQFWTNSYQPYAEFEYHATPKLNVTGGSEGAVIQHSTCCITPTTARPWATFAPSDRPPAAQRPSPTPVPLPRGCRQWMSTIASSPNFSVYGQVATGSIVPPSNVYDYNHTPSAADPTPGLQTPPKQQKSITYQGGLVMKLQRFTLDADAYRVNFQNSYSSVIDPTTTETVYFLQPSSITQGLEFETTAVVATGLNHLCERNCSQRLLLWQTERRNARGSATTWKLPAASGCSKRRPILRW